MIVDPPQTAWRSASCWPARVASEPGPRRTPDELDGVLVLRRITFGSHIPGNRRVREATGGHHGGGKGQTTATTRRPLWQICFGRSTISRTNTRRLADS